MPYYNVTAHTLYLSCMSSAWEWSGGDDSVTKARAWVEAENVFEVWKLVQVWYDLMSTGEAENRYPDPFWDDSKHSEKAVLTQDFADVFIEEIDADFMLEKSRFQGRLAPEFIRLPVHARIAFVQDAYGLIKTSTQIKSEADEPLTGGETMPPLSRPKV
jgi:hypothetical protein